MPLRRIELQGRSFVLLPAEVDSVAIHCSVICEHGLRPLGTTFLPVPKRFWEDLPTGEMPQASPDPCECSEIAELLLFYFACLMAGEGEEW